MKLYKIDKYFVWQGEFNTKDIPKAAKMKWNPDKRRWETSDILVAARLKDYAADEHLKAELIAAEENQLIALAQSSAVDADVDIPAPAGLSYFGYQRAGVRFALERKNTLIADEMGLGKTIQAIGLLNAISFERVLIVCPASLKMNWEKELTKWLVKQTSIRVLSTHDKTPKDDNILIANYEILSKLPWLQQKYEVVIADECHYLKNIKANRTVTFAKIRERADRLLLLTGTPILNRPIELWSLLQLLQVPDMKYWSFVSRYCGASKENNWNTSGASNIEELQLKLRSTVMIRRQKMDVLSDLPPKTRQIVYLDSNTYRDYVDAELSYLQKAGRDLFDNIESLHECGTSHIGEMAKLRHNTAVAKLPDVTSFITELLETVDKIVVFAHHSDVIDGLYNQFKGKAVKLTGGMSVEKKNTAVDEFQTNPNVKIFIGSIQAAGVGLTLTAASTVVFAELDWVPANISQAEDRCHRIGQIDNVTVYHIVVDGSMDAMLANRIIAKQDVIDRATLQVRATAHLESQRIALTAAEDAVKASINAAIASVVLSTTDGKNDDPGASDKVRSDFEEPSYTNEQREFVHAKLRDLAYRKNGVGFEPLDSRFGNQLAMQSYLITNRQCRVAIKMLKKYKKTIGEILFLFEFFIVVS